MAKANIVVIDTKTDLIHFRLNSADDYDACISKVPGEPACVEVESDLTIARLVEVHNANNPNEAVEKFANKAAGIEAVTGLLGDIPFFEEGARKSTKKPAKPKKTPEERAAAVAESWTNPETRAARAQRHGVKVNGEEYRSVRAAFVALGLPLSQHIAFRIKLKASKGGRLNFKNGEDGESYTFTLFEHAKAEPKAKKAKKAKAKKAAD